MKRYTWFFKSLVRVSVCECVHVIHHVRPQPWPGFLFTCLSLLWNVNSWSMEVISQYLSPYKKQTYWGNLCLRGGHSHLASLTQTSYFGEFYPMCRLCLESQKQRLAQVSFGEIYQWNTVNNTSAYLLIWKDSHDILSGK